MSNIKHKLVDHYTNVCYEQLEANPVGAVHMHYGQVDNQSALQRLASEEETTKLKLAAIYEARCAVKSLPYGPGDVMYHKTLGICLVQQIELQDVYSLQAYLPLRIKIAYVDGSKYVDPDTLTPKTETSESIYGK